MLKLYTHIYIYRRIFCPQRARMRCSQRKTTHVTTALLRASSGGALAPELPHATRSTPESIRTIHDFNCYFILFLFFDLFFFFKFHRPFFPLFSGQWHQQMLWEISGNFEDKVGWHKNKTKEGKKKEHKMTVCMGSGWWRVARGGSGAKAPPLAARPGYRFTAPPATPLPPDFLSQSCSCLLFSLAHVTTWNARFIRVFPKSNLKYFFRYRDITQFLSWPTPTVTSFFLSIPPSHSSSVYVCTCVSVYVCICIMFVFVIAYMLIFSVTYMHGSYICVSSFVCRMSGPVPIMCVCVCRCVYLYAHSIV